MSDKMEKVTGAIGKLIGRVLVDIFFTAWLWMMVYNTVALEINLPIFGYWFFVAVIAAVRPLYSSPTKKAV